MAAAQRKQVFIKKKYCFRKSYYLHLWSNMNQFDSAWIIDMYIQGDNQD